MRRRRWKETQKIDLNWQEVLEDNLHAALLSHSLSTGTPIDFHVMPLLTTAASFMNEATVLANEETGWREPSIIWSVVSAPAGRPTSFEISVMENDLVFDLKCISDRITNFEWPLHTWLFVLSNL